jgi:hypothetical protein
VTTSNLRKALLSRNKSSKAVINSQGILQELQHELEKKDHFAQENMLLSKALQEKDLQLSRQDAEVIAPV